MISTILEPALWLLIFKVIYFVIVIHVTGWATWPRLVFEHSRVSNWVFRQTLGISTLLLAAFNLVSFNIPAKWVVVVPFFLTLFRLLTNWKYPRTRDKYGENCDPFGRSLVLYTLGSCVIVVAYLMPFTILGTSGLYAFGGGDQSTYFSISDLVVNQTLKDLMISWGLTWPPTFDFSAMPNFEKVNSNMLPPAPGWSINSFLFYIEYTRQSMVFANQTIATPFISLGFGNSIESYTAGVTVYFLLLCWSAAIFVLTIMRRISQTFVLVAATAAVALSTPAMSLVLKHAIPAAYAWGCMLMFLSVMFVFRHHKTSVKQAIPFGIGIASTYLMYLPALFVSGPLWLYLFMQNIKSYWKAKFSWILALLVVLIIATNIEVDRPLILFFSNATGAILDYGLELRRLHLSLLGAVDFETILTGNLPSRLLVNVAALTILIGVFFYFKQLDRQLKLSLVFVMPIVFAITYYWFKGGQYHVIRMSEFVGLVFVAMAATAFTLMYRCVSKQKAFVITVVGITFLFNAVVIKTNINKRIVSAEPDIRADIIDSNDIKMVEDLQRQLVGHDPQPMVYWMGWGAVPFANHEILFRGLRFAEAFEYDYSSRKFDILAEQNINNAILIYPINESEDILHIKDDALENKKSKIGTRLMQTVGVDSGAAILGTGWLSPTKEEGRPVRYLRSAQEGGLVIWSENPKTVRIDIEASGVESGMFLTIVNGTQEDAESPTDMVTRRNQLESSERELSTKLASHANNFPGVVYIEEDKSGDLKQMTFKLNSYHDLNPSSIQLDFALKKGANILKFVGRDSDGRRSGIDPMTGLIYNSEVAVPYIVFKRIDIGASAANIRSF